MTIVDSSQWLWQQIVVEAERASHAEPVLASFYHANVLNHDCLQSALGFHIATRLGNDALPSMLLRQVFEEAFQADRSIVACACKDLCAYRERDPACEEYVVPLLYYKGFMALQAYRITHYLYANRRCSLALFIQNRISTELDVDIHPAATIGFGIMIDHATAVVIGERVRVGNNVSLLHSVTLGGCGIAAGKKHPRVRDGVLISAGAKLLGDIEVGEGAKIAAGSLVLETVGAHTTVAGVPAKAVGRPADEQPALEMDQQLNESENF